MSGIEQRDLDGVIDDIIHTVAMMDAGVEEFFFRNGNDKWFIVLALWEANGFELAERYEYEDLQDAVEIMLENPSLY